MSHALVTPPEAADAHTSQTDDEEFPRPFGQYLLLENFARGGMGEVYLAKIGGIAGLERTCVLKKLRAELTRDREYVTRFIDEARVVVTLNHANICHVFDVGRVGDEYYLAMEYVSGRDVRTIQDRCRTLAGGDVESADPAQRMISSAIALHLVCETLEALDYAHRRNHPLTGEPLNLVHRDVSPQNVLVSYEGEVKLIDFGLAASKLKVERTQPNVVMGKMAYMAPEQARGDAIDARADLFACGVLAYELIAGERFYEGMSATDIWQVAGKGGFVPQRWSTLDPELAKHIARALHPESRKRFPTCGDFREALAGYLHAKYPGTGVRGVRDTMAQLFASEIKKERELLMRFGKVTVAGFRTTFEESRSQSISLVRAEPSESRGTALVRNEQSASVASGTMPPPSTPSILVTASQPRDVHVETTRLTERIDDLAGPSTDESSATDIARERPEHARDGDELDSDAPTDIGMRSVAAAEPTLRMTRARGADDDNVFAKSASPPKTNPTGTVRPAEAELAADELAAVRGGRPVLLVAATAALVVIGGLLLTLLRTDGDARQASPSDDVAAPVTVVAAAPAAPPPPGPPVPSAIATPKVEAAVAAAPAPPAAAPSSRSSPREATPPAVALPIFEADDGPAEPAAELAAAAEPVAAPVLDKKKRAAPRAVVVEKAEPPKPTRLTMKEVLELGSRCAKCRPLYTAAASLTREDQPAFVALRQCVEKKCR